MENLYELRQRYKIFIPFYKKQKENPEVYNFLFVLLDYIRSCKHYHEFYTNKYNSANDYIIEFRYPNANKYPVTTTPNYTLIYRHRISYDLFYKYLSYWDEITSLYNKVKNKIKNINDEELYLNNGEPTIFTLAKTITYKDTSFLNGCRENIKYPFLSLFPIIWMWKLDKNLILNTSLWLIGFWIVLFLLGIGGIYLNIQPFTFIGATIISILIANLVWLIAENIKSFFVEGSHSTNENIPFGIAVVSFFLILVPLCIFKDDIFSNNSADNSYYPCQAKTQIYDGYEEDDDYITVYTTQYGDCYHSSENCPSLSRSKHIFSKTKEEAKRHYRKCSKCF